MLFAALFIAAPHTLTIIGTADLHGRLSTLPLFAGYLANVRAQHRPVVLVDAGDAFQGTLESDLDEGATVVKAYTALGYDAMAVGNHEFDFGPVGPDTTVGKTGGDPRGALKARAAQAPYPFLAANLRANGRAVSWPHFQPSVLIARDGLKIGIIGAATEDTANTTIAANFVGLSMAKITENVATEAKALRKAGATIVILSAHAGENEITDVAKSLPPGAVDAIIAGHAHKSMGERIAGIPIVESLSIGKAFSRIDLALDDTGHVTDVLAFGPVMLGKDTTYEGAPLREDPRIVAIIAPALARAEDRKKELLGPVLEAPLQRSYEAESALGNLITSLMLDAEPSADMALMNGGGIRADLAKGPLTYGALYNVMPFDNRFALVRQSGKATRRMFAHNIASHGGVLSVAGARVEAKCEDGTLHVDVFLRDRNGNETVLDDKATVTIVTNDFMATGGDSILQDHTMKIAVDAPTIRDTVASRLRTKAPPLDPKTWLDPAAPRLVLPHKRPVHCE